MVSGYFMCLPHRLRDLCLTKLGLLALNEYGSGVIDILIGSVMQSYPARVSDRRLQEDWARDTRKGLRVLMSLRVDFGPMG